MNQYIVIFKDSVFGFQVEEFPTFDEAIKYWDDYADTETCVAGRLIDTETDEIVWSFNEE